jgi:hypothetical protein
MSNIRCTTAKDGRMFHTFEANGVTYALGTVRSRADVEGHRRVNIHRSLPIRGEMSK